MEKLSQRQVTALYSLPFRHGSGWAYSVKQPSFGKNCTTIIGAGDSYHVALERRRVAIADRLSLNIE